jgi:hypothetical protein
MRVAPEFAGNGNCQARRLAQVSEKKISPRDYALELNKFYPS